MHDGVEKCFQNFSEKLKGRYNLADLSVDGKIV
jgi:hypothetical protein